MESQIWPAIARSEPPMPYAQVTATTSQVPGGLANAVRDAFQDAMASRGRLRDEAFAVQGFSGKKFRLFMNNLISEVSDPRYLEIGLYLGASFCSAVYKNKLRAVGIDNWSEYSGIHDVFTANFERFKSAETDVTILDIDFRKVDFDRIGKFNILFYDGSHAEKDQYDGVFMPRVAMDDQFVLIIDDWNWTRVRKGTFDALKDANLEIEYSLEVRTSFNNEHLPLVNGQNSEWHNGMIAAVVRRRM